MKDYGTCSYLELNFVKPTATGRGINSQVVMEKSNSFFTLTEGRVGIRVGRNKPKTHKKPICDWQEIIDSYISKGYVVTKTEKMEKKVIKGGENTVTTGGNTYELPDDPDVAGIIKELYAETDAYIEENYTVSVEQFSPEMMSLGKQILIEMKDITSVRAMNMALERLYAVIPRRIDRLSDMQAKAEEDIPEILKRETDVFETMQMAVATGLMKKQNDSLLNAFGLEWKVASAEEKAEYLALTGGREINNYDGSYMGSVSRMWSVRNLKTQSAFEAFARSYGMTKENKGILTLMHGTPTRNCMGIATCGLQHQTPTGIGTHGKMNGFGNYFANLCRKSLGYTSLEGSRWDGGTSKKGYILLFDVAVGKPYYPSKSTPGMTWEQLQKIRPGNQSVFVKAGVSHLMNDEIITYLDEQSTIRGLIEFTK